MQSYKAYLIGILLSLCPLNGLELNQQSQEETFLVLNALMSNNAAENCEIYDKLYKDTNKTEYLSEALKFCYVAKDKRVNSLVDAGESALGDDLGFLRIKIAKLVDEKKFEQAIKIAKNLIAKDPSERHYLILGTIETFAGKYEDAIKTYTKAYEINQNNDTLLRMVEIMLNYQNDEKRAIQMLETNRKIYGCNDLNCNILADVYKGTHQFSKLPEIYQELYEKSKNSHYIELLWQAHVQAKNYEKAREVLEKYGGNDKVLIQIYATLDKKKEALNLATKKYKETQDKEYLALMAVFEYELNSPNVAPEVLKRVSQNFESSINAIDDPVYYNYYGYLLIDHDLDISKGIKLVEKALERVPDSPYYIDSLAWGLYKQNECKKAGELFNQIPKDSDFFDTDEAKEHIDAVNDCIKANSNDNR